MNADALLDCLTPEALRFVIQDLTENGTVDENSPDSEFSPEMKKLLVTVRDALERNCGKRE